MPYVPPLSAAEIETVQPMPAPHPSRRARLRAHSLLLSHQRYTSPPIARLQPGAPRRVSAWIARWQAWGFGGLSERPRSGRPALCTAEAPHPGYASLDASPTEVKPVVEALEHKTRTRGRTKPITRFIKKSPLWTRRKQAPATAPAPPQDRRRQARMARLHARDSHGAGALWDVDGAGVC
jgi:hypothetical protein